jgi:hypothetical protein
VKKQMPIAPWTRIAQSSGLSNKGQEMSSAPMPRDARATPGKPQACGAGHDDRRRASLHAEADESDDRGDYCEQQDDPVVDE